MIQMDKNCDDEHFNCAVFINIILSCGSHFFPLSVKQQSQTITFHQSILECVRVCKRVLICLSPSCDFNRIWDHQPSFCFSGFSKKLDFFLSLFPPSFTSIFPFYSIYFFFSLQWKKSITFDTKQTRQRNTWTVLFFSFFL